MSIDSFSTSSDKMVDKYGELACECSELIEESTVADSSKSIYQGKVRSVISEIGERVPDPQAVIDVISSRDNAYSTKNVSVMAMKTYYKTIDEFELADRLGQLAEMEDFSPDEYNSSMEVDEWVTEEEVFRIIENLCPDAGEQTKMVKAGDKAFVGTQEHKALVASLYYTGLRVSECMMIELDHIDFKNEVMTVYRMKKGGDKLKEDRIRISQEYIEILQDYMDVCGISSGDLFKFSVRTAQNRITEVDDIYKYVFGEFEHCSKLKPHMFRHGRVTEIARSSDLESAGSYVDHESIETTMGYKHTTTEDHEGILPEDKRQEREEKMTVDDLIDELGVESVEDLKQKVQDDE